ncbi:MAG: hypothetical protein A2287_03015 [Candidatus Melainabacteria bacterium RIFOXYA12_FULL_32_12]|nr:MAG: hypothetical protein A2255_06355 [Candidatus Melainabacteria bacterium RIFOXYA2_FULL_32_9]OGI27503.1 MAG: hypothetical protein A2287_03015 [Candidatus Melainabacteria bacterium RIFOXYA12_FULL_32_12]
MIYPTNYNGSQFKGQFDIEKLPEKKLRGIIMDMSPETVDKISKILPTIESKVEKALPEDDKIEFKLFKSFLFGDNRYKIKYIPGEESRKQGAKPITEENWPHNIEDTIDFVKEIINNAGANNSATEFFNKNTDKKLDLFA